MMAKEAWMKLEESCRGPFNLLTRERRANYVAAILLRILEFLSV